ncbi:helix-turn-helix transcriptional regulator [Frankia sp. R82]|uniref:helix-turn-helix domain-containing protein n=1 Tax=Frankia sp. R82 TaxID=2950553 RepID=UPI0020434312|nr:helix-turn-helix transcriptional regulator [Frankia sp. R82]MCM3886521.1 helix-turn-helix domain-containing protein [Frankia sp. R82]
METFGESLRRWRGQTSIRALAARAHCSTSHICDLELGKRLPSRQTAAALDRALNAGGDLLAIAFADARPVIPWTSAGTRSVLNDVTKDALVDRRAFVAQTGPVLAVLAGGWQALPPGTGLEQTAGRRIGAKTIAQIEARLPQLRALEDQLGGATVRHLVDAELRLVTHLLNEATYTDTQGRRLAGAAGELARLAGWASCDAGYHAAAQRYWGAALHSAHSAGDPVLGANVLKNMTLQLLDVGRRAEALSVADAALAAGQGGTARTRAMLAVRKARAHAALGEHRECTAALAEAGAHHAAGPQDNDPVWVRYFDDAEYCAQVAMTFVELGALAPADRYFALALDPHNGLARGRDRATYLLRHAAVQADLGDLDQATAFARDALAHLEEAPSARNGSRIAEVRTRLAVHRADPAIEELDRQLAACA